MLKKGFSLIEISLVLAIISLLTLLSFPSYKQHMTTIHRLSAKNTLSRLSVAMEEYYVYHHTYKGATLAKLHFANSIEDNRYQLDIMKQTDLAYTLIAKSRDGDLILNSNAT